MYITLTAHTWGMSEMPAATFLPNQLIFTRLCVQSTLCIQTSTVYASRAMLLQASQSHTGLSEIMLNGRKEWGRISECYSIIPLSSVCIQLEGVNSPLFIEFVEQGGQKEFARQGLGRLSPGGSRTGSVVAH